ncbi:MAG: hypothetical protein H7Y88_08385 [Phycisphaerales bacterium]|nr:hypothetical protein [Phycisphaerales bacterium]
MSRPDVRIGKILMGALVIGGAAALAEPPPSQIPPSPLLASQSPEHGGDFDPTDMDAPGQPESIKGHNEQGGIIDDGVGDGGIDLGDSDDEPALGDPCPADFNADGAVASSDITAFMSTWFEDIYSGQLRADFNDSGSVTSADLTAFMTSWFTAVSLGGC